MRAATCLDDMEVPVSPCPGRARIKVRVLQWCHRFHLLALLVLIAGLVVTYLVWRNSEQSALHEMQARFDFSVRETMARIEQRMMAYEQVLHSAEGFMSHTNAIAREEFREFIQKQRLDENYPGIQSISFVQIVPAHEKAHHIATIRRTGFPTYEIFPAGKRALYTADVFIEPFFGRNLRAFGHDPYADTIHRAAMDLARDFDVPVISGKVRLSQEDKQQVQAGFVMYQPVFQFGAEHRTLDERRDQLSGWVSAAFRMDDLMDGLPGQEPTRLDIAIFDGDNMSANTLMYDSNHAYVNHKPEFGLFQNTQHLQVANHTWSILIRSRSAFDSELKSNTPRLIGYGGAGISLLLALLTLVLTNGRERALHAARQMNRELIERETRYRQMFQDTASIAYLLDPGTGRIVDANAAAATFWGYTLERLRGMYIGEINTATHEQIAEVIQQISEGKRTRIESCHRLQNGEVRDVEVYSSLLAYQGKVVLHSIVHDVSARKQAEEALRNSRSELRKLADHQQNIREEERKRITRDIHDELGQNLLALKMDVATLSTRTGDTHPRLHKRVLLVLNNIDATIQSVKTIINNLRPATLELGLYPAVEWQLKQFERRNGIVCQLTAIEQEMSFGLDEGKTAAIFRIFQESLVNIARHANATEVQIALEQTERRFSMRVKDNGQGFFPGNHRKANSFGLMGIKERIEALGGELDISSIPGQGTTLSISIKCS